MQTMYKRKKCRITGNTLEMIKTMYATTKISLLWPGKISQSFNTKIGLKQADELNPLLFNFYINDLHNWTF